MPPARGFFAIGGHFIISPPSSSMKYMFFAFMTLALAGCGFRTSADVDIGNSQDTGPDLEIQGGTTMQAE